MRSMTIRVLSWTLDLQDVKYPVQNKEKDIVNIGG